MRHPFIVAAIILLFGSPGCQADEPPPARTEAEEVAEASAMYDPAAYDTVVWASEEMAIDRGRDIFKWACADCHGAGGEGDGGRVVDGDTLRPPSMLGEDWPYADDPDALHRKVFIGTELGMPHWGLRRMQPRDIVAVEKYIRMELRERPGS